MKLLLKLNKFISAALILVLVSTCAFAYTSFSSVEALSGSQFEAGRIIDDGLFYDGNTMSVSQTQAFLDAKVPDCDSNGTEPYGGTTRKAYAASKGVGTPFICLKDFHMNTPFKAGESGLCAAIPARSNRSAAQIINAVATSCNVSEKVLLVMLQKEQGLVTDDWPWPIQYTKAMGYYCPDDPDNPGWCHPDYAGFFNQVYNAARQFQRYKADPENWNHIPFSTNNILYQANAPSCGSRSVYIENYATAGLYNYTPYTPNQSALNNLYGTGNSCSAYGNRNFWRYYNDWFGSTHYKLNFKPMHNARYMRLKSATTKTNLRTGQDDGGLLPEGMEIYFSTRYEYEGELYVRTEIDTNKKRERGILYSDLEEIEPVFESMSTPRWMEMKVDSPKVDPITQAPLGGLKKSGEHFYFADKITIGDELFLRTEYNAEHDHHRVIPYDVLSNIPLEYEPLSTPRWMEITKNIEKVHPTTNVPNGVVIPAGTVYFFDTKIRIGNDLMLRTKTDTDLGENLTIPYSSSKDSILNFEPMHNARDLRIKSDLRKTNFRTGMEDGAELAEGTEIYFTTRYEYEGELYVRTEHDSSNKLERGIRYADLEEVD